MSLKVKQLNSKVIQTIIYIDQLLYKVGDKIL
jgi:hypothetical protein